MKKTLSVFLAAIMVLSMLVVSAAAAPEGTAVKTAAEFAAMTADGKYYLANDITIDTTYGTTFTGVFDGNGKTITTTVPVFTELAGGTVKNLTVAGAIEFATSPVAALTIFVTKTAAGDTVLENVTNNANVTNTNGIAAGLVGRVFGIEGVASSLTLKGCVNNGKISGTSHCGGLVGYKDDTTKKAAFALTFTDCVNNAEVTTSSTSKVSCAGLCGSAANGSNDADLGHTITATNCVNNGFINAPATAAATYAGAAGLFGSVSGKVTITNCKNTGNVTAAGNHVAGIVATTRFAWCSVEIANCDNYGTLTGTGKVAEFLANTEKAVAEGSGYSYTIKNCYTANKDAVLYGGTEDPSRVTLEGTPAAQPNVTEAPAETQPAETQPAATDPTPATGDNSVWFVIVAAVAAIGSAVIIVRRKEN